MVVNCTRCGKPFDCASALRRHLARKRPCAVADLQQQLPPQLPLGSRRASWSQPSAVRIPAAAAIQSLFATAALSAYCSRAPIDRVNERSSLAPVANIVMGLLKASHRDPTMVNIRAAAATTHAIELYVDGWRLGDITAAIPVIIEAACDELRHYIEREPGSFTLTVRCAISTAILSIRCCSPEWEQQLNAALDSRLVAYLRDVAARRDAALPAAALPAAAEEAFQVMPRRPPKMAPVPPPPIAVAPRRTLSVESAAEIYNEYKGVADLTVAARNMLVAAAALLGENASARSLSERLEQKLWEASADGLIADDQKKQVEEIRKYLLDAALAQAPE